MTVDYRSLVYALLSAVAASFVAVFGKAGLQGIDVNAATAIRSCIMALFLIGVVAVQGHWQRLQDVFASGRSLFFICVSGLAGALSWLFYFMALKHGKVAQVAPIDKLSVVFATLFAVLFLGEKISAMGTLGVFLIAAGAILVALG